MPVFFDQKTQKVILVQKKHSGKTKKYQESCQNQVILPEYGHFKRYSSKIVFLDLILHPI